MTESEKEDFINGFELAKDWNMTGDITPEQAALYEKLIKERSEKQKKDTKSVHCIMETGDEKV